MRHHSRGTGLAAALATVGLVVAACGGGGTTSSGGSTPATQPSSAPPSTTVSGTPVTVKLTEFAIQLSQQTFAPGTYTFVTSNDGKTVHALEIVGPGGLDEKTDTFRGGQLANLTVTLQPGSYELYCPVGNHKELGMDTAIQVSATGATGTSLPPPTGGGH